MKRSKKLLKYLAFLGILPVQIIFFQATNLSGSAEIFGSIESNNYLILKTGKIDTARINLNLKFEESQQRYHFFAELNLNSTIPTSISDLSNLSSPSTVMPLSTTLNEAYLDIFQFPIGIIDMRLGKQIIVWGTADKLNPTANLCPSDLRDIFNFGEKIGITAIKFDLYPGPLQIEGVVVPYFNPSPLPENFTELSGAQLGITHIEMPDEYLGENIQFGLKTSWFIGKYDFSLSYYYGRYWVPVAYRVDLSGTYTVDDTYMFFPKVQVAGFDFTGSLGNVGTWVELAVFIPEEYSLTTIVSGIPVGSEEKSDICTRYVLGADYTFSDGTYINTQFAHGLDFENQKDLIKDYLMLRLEKSFLNDKIKVHPITLFATTGDIDNIKNNYGLGYIPEIQIFPSDNTELNIGAVLLEGKGNNLITNIEKRDSLYIEFKVSF